MAYKDVISGIYTITHVESGRKYVGSAANIYSRWAYHRSSFRSGKRCSPYLKNAWDKYGENAFRFDIIERVPDKSQLVKREQHWIDFYNSADRDRGFNIAPKAGSRLGVRQSPETIAKTAAANRGQKRSDECKRMISARMQGNKCSEGIHHGILKESDILPIFRDVASGRRIEDIANELDVHRDSVSRVIKRKTWNHIDIPDDVLAQAKNNYKNRRRDGQRNNTSRTKLNPNSVSVIKTRILAGDNYRDIARDYGVSPETIKAIKYNRLWKDVNFAQSL